MLTLLSFLGSSGLARTCDSARDPKARAAVDLAPPTGYVDVCSRDAQLCKRLTEGYPPSVQTLAYFVLAKEWQLHERGALDGFTQYLIAQRALRPYSTEACCGPEEVHAMHLKVTSPIAAQAAKPWSAVHWA